MAGGLSEAASSVGTQIGRYFSLTALLPSLVFVAWIIALHGAAEQPFGQFDLGGVGKALSDWSLEKGGLALAASLLLGLLVHPLLYATTQLLEGYWGTCPFAVRLATALALRHRRRQDRLDQVVEAIECAIETKLDVISRERIRSEKRFNKLTDQQKQAHRVVSSVLPRGAGVHGLIIARDSIRKALDTMPEADRVLPTRLGNALRRVEDSVGKQYGLELITIAPHLAVAAAPARAAYVEDSQEQLDVSVRLTFYGLLAAVLSTVWLLGAGWWLLVALLPYGFAYVTYRGAVASAAEWGAAMATCVDLDRFALYDAMRVEWPADTQTERERNEQLMELLGGNEEASVTYVQHPST